MNSGLHSVSKKEVKSIKLFWLGFTIYSFAYTLTSIPSIPVKISQAAQLPGLILLIAGSVKLISLKLESIYLKIFFNLYFIWLLFIVSRGIGSVLNYSGIKDFLFDANFGGLIYFAPLLVLFPKSFYFYKTLFNTIIVFAILYLVLDVVFVKYLLNPDRTSLISLSVVEIFSQLSFPCGFLLLAYLYNPRQKQFLIAGVILLSILLAIYRARRGMILMFSDVAIFSYLLYILNSKFKFLIIYLSILAILCTALYASGIYKPENSHLFGFLAQRGSEDTRSDVEIYFYADMKPNDWIRGKGMNGKYFCPGIDEGATTDYRNVIETGYLQMILKGGIINVVLYLLIAVPAIFLGLFFSKNLLSKAAGVWILLSLLHSYPTIVNNFTLQYLIVWISVGICYSKKLRKLQDRQLQEIFLHEI